jgi:hypothetical protein
MAKEKQNVFKQKYNDLKTRNLFEFVCGLNGGLVLNNNNKKSIGQGYNSNTNQNDNNFNFDNLRISNDSKFYFNNNNNNNNNNNLNNTLLISRDNLFNNNNNNNNNLNQNRNFLNKSNNHFEKEYNNNNNNIKPLPEIYNELDIPSEEDRMNINHNNNNNNNILDYYNFIPEHFKSDINYIFNYVENEKMKFNNNIVGLENEKVKYLYILHFLYI